MLNKQSKFANNYAINQRKNSQKSKNDDYQSAVNFLNQVAGKTTTVNSSKDEVNTFNSIKVKKDLGQINVKRAQLQT